MIQFNSYPFVANISIYLKMEAKDATKIDPFLSCPSSTVSEGEFVLLIFPDKRQYFAQALRSQRGKSPSLKINKRSYSTHMLIGLPYGSVLELQKNSLIPLPEGEDVIPNHQDLIIDTEQPTDNTEANDNRHLVDSNTSQGLSIEELAKMRDDKNVTGAEIVDKIIQNSSTFQNKTSFSKAKYIKKKQMKYQPRCRIVKCTSASVCEALYLKDARRIMNLREDSLGQILSYSNVTAGSKVLIFDTCMGLVTGALAQRMGGYGLIHAVYTGMQPSYQDIMAKFNLNFREHSSIRWVHAGYLFHDETNTEQDLQGDDLDKIEREKITWPCHLQPHTEKYLLTMESEKKRVEFLQKRCGRFARKLTRPTLDETYASLKDGKKCDSLIIASQYDPKETLTKLLPFLETSCPFVVFSDYMEPLLECFEMLQKEKLAINIRLSDTWLREYQVLPNRTHPNMNMSQNGGFILTGVKLCPIHGINELDDDLMKEIRAEMGTRRGGKKRKNCPRGGEENKLLKKKPSMR